MIAICYHNHLNLGSVNLAKAGGGLHETEVEDHLDGQSRLVIVLVAAFL